MHCYTEINAIKEQPLSDGSNYIYILKNYPQGNVKIGITSNPKQRFRSLSGSNSGGNRIVKITISSPTYYYKMERLIQERYTRYRIPKSEWFSGIDYDTVVGFMQKMFDDPAYTRVNEKYKKMQERA